MTTNGPHTVGLSGTTGHSWTSDVKNPPKPAIWTQWEAEQQAPLHTDSPPPTPPCPLHTSHPQPHLTLLEDEQPHVGGPAHDVRGVLGVAGEGAVVVEVQVLDQDGAVAAPRVPHKLQPVPEWPLVVQIGHTTGVVENLQIEK